MIVEFFGMSRAGKSTQKSLLLQNLEKNGLKSVVFQRPNKTFREFGSLEAFNQYMVDEMSRAHDAYIGERADFLVYDRGFYDRIALLSADCGRGRVDQEYTERMIKQLNERKKVVNFPILFLVSPEISLERWSAQKRMNMDSTPMNLGLNTMDDLQGLRYLEGIYREIKKDNPKVIEIEGEKGIAETSQNIFSVLALNGCS